MICKRFRTETQNGWIVEMVAIHRDNDADPVMIDDVVGSMEELLGTAGAEVATAPTLETLTLSGLKDLVDRWEVDTAAQTAAGLRRAIERHLEEAGQ